MSFWNKIKSVGSWIKNHSGTLLGLAQTGFEYSANFFVPGAGTLAKIATKALGKASSVAGHLTNLGKDVVLDNKVSGLQETASALKNSQSLLKGQVTELQAGLQEAKDNELALAAEQQRLARELTQATEETKQELELQKAALEQAIKANESAQEQMQTALQATQAQIEEMQNRMADNEQAIQILQDASLSQEEKINSLNDLMENERQRLDAFENQMANFNQRLAEQETKLNQHSEQINSLHQQHLELEQQVQENKAHIQVNQANISQNQRGIQREENQRIIAVNQVKVELIETQEKLQAKTKQLSLSQEWNRRQTEQKLAAERAERERVEAQAKANEKRNRELAEQLAALQAEIRAEKFKKEAEAARLAKLNQYAELKAEQLELEKELKTYAGVPEKNAYEADRRLARWLGRPKHHKKNRLGRGFTIPPYHPWAKWYPDPEELFAVSGCEVSSEWVGVDFIIDTKQLEKDIDQQFLTPLYNSVSPVDVDEKAKLLTKLTHNKELLLAFASELGLPSEVAAKQEESPVEKEKSPEQPQPKPQKKTKKAEQPQVETGQLKLAVRQTVTDFQQLFLKIPGATMASSFPWQFWLLLLLLSWLLKKLLWFYFFKPKAVVKDEAEKKEVEPKETEVKLKTEPKKAETKPKKRRQRISKTAK